jgi:hypothetical protein
MTDETSIISEFTVEKWLGSVYQNAGKITKRLSKNVAKSQK